MITRKFPIGLMLLFVALSAADFIFTWHLIARSGVGAYEANPIANWWLAQHGWVGLAGFKAAVSTVVIGLAAAIHWRRPRAGRRLLVFGCAAVGVVVSYGGYLSFTAQSAGGGLERPELDQYARESRSLDRQILRNRDYQMALNSVSGDLAAERCTLAEAVDRLAGAVNTVDLDWLRTLRILSPEFDDRGCLATAIARHALRSVTDSPELLARLSGRIRHELRAICGADVPFEDGAIAVRSGPQVTDVGL